MKADTLENVYKNFHNKSIAIDELNELYVETELGRGTSPLKKIERNLYNDPKGSLKILLAGYKGCGKSTELIKLQKNINKDFIVLNYSVAKELDILNVNYIELFIVTMEKLFEFVNNNNISISNKFIKNITNWLKTEEIKHVDNTYLDMDLMTGIDAKATIPFFTKIFAKLTATAKASSSFKKEIQEKIEPKLSELILNCNLLINEIKEKLNSINKKGLIIVIEDLDKLEISKAIDIFYNHSPQITQLNCHCIFTFSIALFYNIKYNNIKNTFDETCNLPMVKIKNKDGSQFKPGMKILKEIIEKRMSLSLFENDEIINKIIEYSGGCLWDLFKLIKDSADNALDLMHCKIKEEDFIKAFLSLKNDYENTIADNKDENITAQEYYDELRKCAESKDKKPLNTDIMLSLRYNLSVLGYNGDGWCDVHPIIIEILKDKKMIKQ